MPCHIRNRFIGYVPEISNSHTSSAQYEGGLSCRCLFNRGEEWSAEKNLRPVMCVCKRLYVDLMSFWWKANHQLAIKMWFTLRHESKNVPSSHKVTTEEHSGVESVYEDDVSTMMGWWWRRQQQHLKDRQEQAHKLQWRKVLGVMYDIYGHSCKLCRHTKHGCQMESPVARGGWWWWTGTIELSSVQWKEL